MVVNSLINDTGIAGQLFVQIGQVGLWIQALGIAVILWAIIQLIALWFNWRRMREVYMIKRDMKRIEEKIDRVLGKRR